jgi:glucose 1-dehydrogenase
MSVLEGKVAVITGGSRGFGLAIARAYVQAGAAVVIASRSAQSVTEAVEALKQSGGTACGQACDAGSLEQMQNLGKGASESFGHFDIWINNAAISAPYGPTMHIPSEAFIQTLQTDIFGVYYGSRVAMHHFLKRGEGKLINILGRGDRQPVPMQNAYAASKAWVNNFTIALAKEYRESGVGVYAYNPGLMKTDLMKKIQAIQGYTARLEPLKTVMQMWAKSPEKPAQKAVWLASSATDQRTGLIVRELSPGAMLSGLLLEAWRVISRQPAQPWELDITTIPPDLEIARDHTQ